MRYCFSEQLSPSIVTEDDQPRSSSSTIVNESSPESPPRMDGSPTGNPKATPLIQPNNLEGKDEDDDDIPLLPLNIELSERIQLVLSTDSDNKKYMLLIHEKGDGERDTRLFVNFEKMLRLRDEKILSTH